MRAVFIVLAFLAFGLLMYWTGAENRQANIEVRALEIYHQNCYNWQDIESVVFGEIQE